MVDQPNGDDRIALMDQGSFLGLRALGHQPCFHATWTYRRAVDLDVLGRFNEALEVTLLGRLVERSPLPGGRHRWAAVAEAPPLEIEDRARDRDEVLAWTDEFGERGTDPEVGPGWRIGVLPLTDGGAAVTMIVPHTLGDGLCVLQAIDDAVSGVTRRPRYPVRGERRRTKVLIEDLAGLLRSIPSVVRAIVAGIALARGRTKRSKQHERSEPRKGTAIDPPAPTRGSRASGLAAGSAEATTDLPLRVPVACVRLDQTDWDRVAAERGGTSNTLVSAVAVRLGDRFGRTGRDGTVTLAVPVSVRTEDDTRANALDSATIHVAPEALAENLAVLRAATKAALVETAARSHELLAALPLTPLMPAAAVRKGEALAMGSDELPVGCSNYGDLPAGVALIDGAEPDDFWVRLNEPGMVPADLDRIGGQLYVLSGRALGRVFLSVVARPVGGGLDRGDLHRHLAEVLAEFDLRPDIVTT